MAKSRKTRTAKSARAVELTAAPVPIEPTILLTPEPDGTWIYSAWEPGTAETHWIVDGELGRIDKRRMLDAPADSVARLPALIDHELACFRAAYQSILAREPAAELGWKGGGVIRMTMSPEMAQLRLDHKARARARPGSDAGETRTAAPTFAGFGDDS